MRARLSQELTGAVQGRLIMIESYFILLGALFILTCCDIFRTRHFRGFAIPARIVYGLLILNEIWLGLHPGVPTFWQTAVIIILILFLIGLIETAFRNKIANHLSYQFIAVLCGTFLLVIVVSWILMCAWA